jgi:hypothetical protein
MILLHSPALGLLWHFNPHESRHSWPFYKNPLRPARKLLNLTAAWSLRLEHAEGMRGYSQFKDRAVVSAKIATAESTASAAAAPALGGGDSLVCEQVAQPIGAHDRDPRIHRL